MMAMPREGTREPELLWRNIDEELRAPLVGVLNWADLIALDPLHPRQREAVDEIRRAGGFLLQALDEFLDLSRIELDRLRLARTPMGLTELAANCVELTSEAAAARSIRLVSPSHADGEIHALGDPERLEQVVHGLLATAVKHTRRRGTVWIAVEREDARAMLSITTSGPAIATPSLRLALHRRLAELMGGSITIDAERGRPSVLRLDLECTEGPPCGSPS